MKELPTLPPQVQQQVDQFHAGMTEVFGRYLHSVEMDANRHAVKHGPMPEERMVWDLTRLLVAQVSDQGNALNLKAVCGMLSVAICQGIERKRKGKG